MQKFFLLLLFTLGLGFRSVSAQEETLPTKEIIFCNDVDEHDGKCKPEAPSKEWKLSNGQISLFGLIKFPDGANYPKLLIKIYRNGNKVQPFFSDDVGFDKGSKCVRTNLVFTKSGNYNVQITDDDGKLIVEGNLVVKGGHGLSDL